MQQRSVRGLALGSVALAVLGLVLVTAPALAAGKDARAADGAALSLLWGLPFAGMLLSIALCPLLIPRIWHHHYGHISYGWAALFLVPFGLTYGADTALYEAVHVLAGEYIPFMILLTALFVVGGGVLLRGQLSGSPLSNTTILGIGTVLAGWMGTTGAAMLLIRPLIRANAHRAYNAHVFVFFIFLVANIGGSLTPLGDPPLFLGFLQGIDFFWFFEFLLVKTVFLSVILLAVFFAIDTYIHRRDGGFKPAPGAGQTKLSVEGLVNFALLGAVIGAVLINGVWKSGVEITVYGTKVSLQQLVSSGLLLVIAGLSMKLTPKQLRDDNQFTWAPMVEVYKLFIGIFLTIIPVLAILRAGPDAALGWLIKSVSSSDGQPINWMYFWITGGLSSFLDNAPSWLLMYNVAGGGAERMMTTFAPTLVAISAAAVFMGANTYIGNAPNFMVKAVCEERGVRMPSFFGYMAWAGCVLVPLFVVMTFLFFT
ncbi:MAG: sodium:proton antiporter [Alphaproteobacteria bacterium]|nr:MAG: sodium:proton antiporter [Alphaproteobacteria bacterium]